MSNDKPAFDITCLQELGIKVLVTDVKNVRKHHRMLRKVRRGGPIHPNSAWARKHAAKFVNARFKQVPVKAKDAPMNVDPAEYLKGELGLKEVA